MGHKYKDVMGLAQACMDRFDKSQICIISVDKDSGKLSVISTGKNKKDKENAKKSEGFIKNVLGIK